MSAQHAQWGTASQSGSCRCAPRLVSQAAAGCCVLQQRGSMPGCKMPAAHSSAQVVADAAAIAGAHAGTLASTANCSAALALERFKVCPDVLPALWVLRMQGLAAVWACLSPPQGCSSAAKVQRVACCFAPAARRETCYRTHPHPGPRVSPCASHCACCRCCRRPSSNSPMAAAPSRSAAHWMRGKMLRRKSGS